MRIRQPSRCMASHSGALEPSNRDCPPPTAVSACSCVCVWVWVSGWVGGCEGGAKGESVWDEKLCACACECILLHTSSVCVQELRLGGL